MMQNVQNIHCPVCKRIQLMYTTTGRTVNIKCKCSSMESKIKRTENLIKEIENLDPNECEMGDGEEIIENIEKEKGISSKVITEEDMENLEKKIKQNKEELNTYIKQMEDFIENMKAELDKFETFKNQKKEQIENIFKLYDLQIASCKNIGINNNLTNKKSLFCYLDVEKVKRHNVEEIKGNINHLKSIFTKHFKSIENLEGFYSYFETEYKIEKEDKWLQLFGEQFNENELKDKCIMILNGEKIEFTKKQRIKKEYLDLKTHKLMVIMKPNCQLNTMKDLFNHCKNLISVDFSHMDTQKVTSMECAFNNCVNLSSINLSGINTESLTNLYWTFMYCKNVSYIDLQSFNTKKVTNMSGAFQTCESLANLELNFENLNVENVLYMSNMFENCTNLLELNLSSFSTLSVESIQCMFHNCYSLKSLDLSHFSTANVKNNDSFFENCYCLTELKYDPDIFSFKIEDSEPDENTVMNNCGLSEDIKSKLLNDEDDEDDDDLNDVGYDNCQISQIEDD